MWPFCLWLALLYVWSDSIPGHCSGLMFSEVWLILPGYHSGYHQYLCHLFPAMMSLFSSNFCLFIVYLRSSLTDLLPPNICRLLWMFLNIAYEATSQGQASTHSTPAVLYKALVSLGCTDSYWDDLLCITLWCRLGGTAVRRVICRDQTNRLHSRWRLSRSLRHFLLPKARIFLYFQRAVDFMIFYDFML